MPSEKITIIYDNRASREDLRPGWGFSALVEHDGARLLFDTGADKIVLEANAAALGVDLKSTDYLFFSHEHCDHVGAVSSALHKDLTVVYPSSLSQTFNKKVVTAQAKSILVTEPIEFSPGFLSTGELGTTIKEQALIITGNDGPILVTGCAHPGIAEIARLATQIAKRPLSLVIGGFHLYKSKDAEIKKIADALRQLGVQQIAPCHCTGEHAIKILREAFGPDDLEVMVGTQIPL